MWVLTDEQAGAYALDWGLSCCYSVTKFCPTLCDPMDCSILGFPVLHFLPQFAQTHVHWVGNAIQPSHFLLPPSPPALNSKWKEALRQMRSMAAARNKMVWGKNTFLSVCPLSSFSSTTLPHSDTKCVRFLHQAILCHCWMSYNLTQLFPQNCTLLTAASVPQHIHVFQKQTASPGCHLSSKQLAIDWRFSYPSPGAQLICQSGSQNPGKQFTY